MRFSQAWIIARHDMGIFRHRLGIMGPLLGLPLGVGIGFPLLVHYIVATNGPSGLGSYLPQLIEAFSFWFVIGAGTVPTAIAAYRHRRGEGREEPRATPLNAYDGWRDPAWKNARRLCPHHSRALGRRSDLPSPRRLVYLWRAGLPLLPELGGVRLIVRADPARLPVCDRVLCARLFPSH